MSIQLQQEFIGLVTFLVYLLCDATNVNQTTFTVLHSVHCWGWQDALLLIVGALYTPYNHIYLNNQHLHEEQGTEMFYHK